MSVFMYCSPLTTDHCMICMILNYLIIISLAMSLSFGASVISFSRYSELSDSVLETSYFAMSLYFMGLGFLFAILISVILGISYGIHQRQGRELFNFTRLQEV